MATKRTTGGNPVMTIPALYDNDLNMIDLALPEDLKPELLIEARSSCLSLLERLELVGRWETTGQDSDHDGEEIDPSSGWHALKHDTAGKMERARLRLAEIDRGLSGLRIDQ